VKRSRLDIYLAVAAAAAGIAGLLLITNPWFGARRAPLRGVVISVDAPAGRAVVRHDSLPGVMPAMTMSLRVEPRRELERLREGDSVEAVLELTRDRSRLTGVRVVGRTAGAAGLAAGEPAPAPGGPGASRAAGADALAGFPRLPDVRLRDAGGRRFRTSELRGMPVALGFLYTRCAIPEACPRLARQLSETQELIGGPTELRGQARLLTVTLDPKYDTPARLARYGRERGADPALWTLATGDSAALAALLAAAGITVRGAGPGMVHEEALIVYRPDGRPFRRLEGTRWTPRELAQALEEAARPEDRP